MSPLTKLGWGKIKKRDYFAKSCQSKARAEVLLQLQQSWNSLVLEADCARCLIKECDLAQQSLPSPL